MAGRQQQFGGTGEVLEAHRFDEQHLEGWLTENLPGFRGPLGVRQFRGGQSNPTYLLSAVSGRYVLRRKPPGDLLASAHAVDREYRVMRALAQVGFPVPRPLVLCTDETVTGTIFYVMEFLDGRIFWEPELPGVAADERGRIYDNLNATIARLHALDYRSLGLEDFGKPGNYFERQISRWSRQYAASETSDIPAMNRLIDWLPRYVPADDSSSLVHGDFRPDNVVVADSGAEVLGVLDWELSTIGHPLADFTYHLMLWDMPDLGIGSTGLAGKPLDELGIPDADAYVARYCERTGRDGIPDRDFYGAYNFFRLAAILQGIAGRVRDGTAASAWADRAAAAVEPLAELGWAKACRHEG